MITVNQAVSIIKSSVVQLKTEYINVENSMNRILAADIKSKADSPPFDMSSMDGYAVKINKYSNQTKFKVINEIFAGDNKNFKVLESQTIRVFTGSKMPLGANRVIIQENCKLTNKLEITAKINDSDEIYIRKKGQDFKKGALILKKQHQVNSRDIGLLVTSGIKKVLVYKKPKIAIIATGNELINIDKKIGKGQIYASSLFMLKELVNSCNSSCKALRIIKDNEISIKNNISNLKKMDLVITTGGVSVGKKDLVKKCLEDLGMKTKFWKVKVKPGKPILFGLLNNIPVFGLPGNPVSSYVCFIIFVMEAIKKLLPYDANYITKSKAHPVNKLINNSERETYYRGSFFTKNNKRYVNIFKNQDSSLMKNLSLANCLVKVPAKKIALKSEFLEIYELNNGL